MTDIFDNSILMIEPIIRLFLHVGGVFSEFSESVGLDLLDPVLLVFELRVQFIF